MELSTERPTGVGDDVMDMVREQGAEQKKAEEVVARLIEDVDENFSLYSWGYTKPLKITRGSKVEHIRLKIKSAGIAEVMDAWQKKSPIPPTTRETIKKDSPEGRQLGYRRDIVVDRINEGDPSFVQKRSEFQNELGKEVFLRSIAYDLYDNKRLVLKGKDLSEPNEIIDAEAALRIVFKKWGLTMNHFAQVTTDARELTESKETEENLQ